jgi:predicted dehydrogenase
MGMAAATAIGAARPARAAAEEFVLGAIGCGGRGTFLAASFANYDDVKVAYVCDPDERRAEAAAKQIETAKGYRPKVVKDLRRVLEDGSVDAVTIGTPDHWHGPATLLAIDAGKHVYVEKPCSHNIREGRLMVEAARRNKKVVQTGTQSRSGQHVIDAMKKLHEGAIGKVLSAKVWNSQIRGNIGHAAPSEPPAGFDYDLWLGPAPHVPFQANRHHYTWHWWYAFGTGDMGNDGVHDLDLGRWGLGMEIHPSTITAIGGKYFFDDDQQFPDTQTVIFEYPGDGKVGSRRQLIFELRIWSPYRQEGYENGNAFYGTEGMLLLGKGDDWKLYGPKNQLLESGGLSDRETPHQRNFLECIKSGKRPNADVEIGHYSASLCHLGNIAARLGRTLHFDGKKEQFVGDDEANKLVTREYRRGHWAVPKGA